MLAKRSPKIINVNENLIRRFFLLVIIIICPRGESFPAPQVLRKNELKKGGLKVAENDNPQALMEQP